MLNHIFKSGILSVGNIMKQRKRFLSKKRLQRSNRRSILICWRSSWRPWRVPSVQCRKSVRMRKQLDVMMVSNIGPHGLSSSYVSFLWQVLHQVLFHKSLWHSVRDCSRRSQRSNLWSTLCGNVVLLGGSWWNYCCNKAGQCSKMGSIMEQGHHSMTDPIWSIDHRHAGRQKMICLILLLFHRVCLWKMNPQRRRLKVSLNR